MRCTVTTGNHISQLLSADNQPGWLLPHEQTVCFSSVGFLIAKWSYSVGLSALPWISKNGVCDKKKSESLCVKTINCRKYFLFWISSSFFPATWATTRSRRLRTGRLKVPPRWWSFTWQLITWSLWEGACLGAWRDYACCEFTSHSCCINHGRE